ncbi:MAG: hypothetical protein AB9882_14815 [Ignavibacteriaceae bacterium]
MLKNYITKIIVLSLTLTIFFALQNCTDKKDDNPQLGELLFNIDTSLISSTITDTSFLVKFNPPKFWTSNKSTFRLFLESELNGLNPERIYFFSDNIDSAYLKISRIPKPDTFPSDKNIFKDYDTLIKSALGNFILKSGNYLKDGFTVHQYLIDKSGYISFLLLFSNTKGEILSFEYTAGKGNYQKVLKSIESSIGSIKLIQSLISRRLYV